MIFPTDQETTTDIGCPNIVNGDNLRGCTHSNVY